MKRTYVIALSLLRTRLRHLHFGYGRPRSPSAAGLSAVVTAVDSRVRAPRVPATTGDDAAVRLVARSADQRRRQPHPDQARHVARSHQQRSKRRDREARARQHGGRTRPAADRRDRISPPPPTSPEPASACAASAMRSSIAAYNSSRPSARSSPSNNGRRCRTRSTASRRDTDRPNRGYGGRGGRGGIEGGTVPGCSCNPHGGESLVPSDFDTRAKA